ncbi:MAG: ATP-binding protein [Planctomycetota bacterium]
MTVWTGLFVGVAGGVLLSLPLAAAWSRLAERRVLRSQKRAQRAERLAELGTMTGGLAHEIKNPLSTIGLNIQLLQEDLADAQRELSADARSDEPPRDPRLAARDADLRDRLSRVSRRLDGLHRETHRLRDILDDFLKFAGRLQLHREPTDLHVLLEELADFFAPQAGDAGIQLRLDLHADPHEAAVDAGLLKQALLNLMINATQAMTQARVAGEGRAHGGANELHLRTSNPAPEKNRKRGPRPDTEQVCLHVTDTGPGIPDDVLPRIFEPYFSKRRGGTGLGLPTTKRIIEEHGGTLTVHSEPARGTSFTISLPTQAAGPDDSA